MKWLEPLKEIAPRVTRDRAAVMLTPYAAKAQTVGPSPQL
jgi:hypothetical protein